LLGTIAYSGLGQAAGWLPRNRDQLRAQPSLLSMGLLYFIYLFQNYESPTTLKYSRHKSTFQVSRRSVNSIPWYYIAEIQTNTESRLIALHVGLYAGRLAASNVSTIVTSSILSKKLIL